MNRFTGVDWSSQWYKLLTTYCGRAGCLRNFSEQLQWATVYDGFVEMLQGLKEAGSLIFWMSLLDTAMVIPFWSSAIISHNLC